MGNTDIETIREQINSLLDKKTGNTYNVYVDSCSSMAVLGKVDILQKMNPVDIAKNFQLLFDLKSIENEQQREDVGMQNRFFAVLFDFADNSRPNIWKKVPGVGILATDENKETVLLTSKIEDGDAKFLLYKSLDVLPVLSERVRNQGSLALLKMDNKEDFISSLELVEEGYDIADFYTFLQDFLPEDNKKQHSINRISPSI